MGRTFKVLDEKELEQVNGGKFLNDCGPVINNNLRYSQSDTPGVNDLGYDTSGTPVATMMSAKFKKGKDTKDITKVSGGPLGTGMA